MPRFSSTKIEIVLALPVVIEPNQFYLVENPSETTKLYISDTKRNLFLLNEGNSLDEVEITITTEELADGATETGSVEIAKSFAIKEITASDFTWFRLYGDPDAVTEDSAREFSDWSFMGTEHRMILSLLLDVETGLVWSEASTVPGSNTDDPNTSNAYYSIKNTSGSPAAITVTMKVLILET